MDFCLPTTNHRHDCSPKRSCRKTGWYTQRNCLKEKKSHGRLRFTKLRKFCSQIKRLSRNLASKLLLACVGIARTPSDRDLSSMLHNNKQFVSSVQLSYTYNSVQVYNRPIVQQLKDSGHICTQFLFKPEKNTFQPQINAHIICTVRTKQLHGRASIKDASILSTHNFSYKPFLHLTTTREKSFQSSDLNGDQNCRRD